MKDIAQIDEILKILRDGWMDAIPEKKQKWIAQINNSLDERLVLMKRRDLTKD